MEDKKSQREEPKKRCLVCNKRVGLLGFACRCGGTYCAAHRADDKHGCTFDYATVEKQILETKLVKIDSSRDSLVI